MASQKEIAQRFDKYLNLKGFNPTQIARQTGVHRQTIYNFLNGRTAISSDKLGIIADICGINLNWLLNGQGPMERETSSDEKIEKLFKEGMLQSIPLLPNPTVANNWLVSSDEQHNDYIVMYAAWKTHNDFVALRLRGDAMEPKIPDHSIVIVDLKRTQLKDRSIGVFSLDDEILVKYWRDEVNGIRLQSHSREYRDIHLRADELDQHDFFIHGQVVYGMTLYEEELNSMWIEPFKSANYLDIDKDYIKETSGVNKIISTIDEMIHNNVKVKHEDMQLLFQKMSDLFKQ